MAVEEKVLGLIAGQGRLPFMVAAGARKAGYKVICLGIIDNADKELRDQVDQYYTVPLARLGNWIGKLRRHDVHGTIMVGRIAKAKIYTPWRIMKYLPDWRAFRIWYWRLRDKDKRTDSLLGALADELATGGIMIEDSTKYCTDHMADEGLMNRCQAPGTVQGDIEFGWQLVKRIGELDIGQAMAVREKEVIAVEAIEGTAAMIERAGGLCKKGGWTLIKTAKPGQDLRFDVPCVGPDTIRQLAENGGRCLVLEAGRTIIIDKPETLALADELGITVFGHSNK